ncbi:MAG TPA: hypothetical protein OIM07_01555 [Clostridiales bacterium]|jgi:hypothetical protein|nr:hypothetical protein [Christensenellales bacterium]HJH66950.1 hypothetical protein [Clostridiales bacterium]HJH78351.1 hypothetical protein [Clostridiales bacterium]
MSTIVLASASQTASAHDAVDGIMIVFSAQQKNSFDLSSGILS